MKILITGGEGGIAQGIKEWFTDLDDEILVPSRETLDVCDEVDVIRYMKAYTPDVIVNCAGYIKPVSLIDSDPQTFITHFDINTYGAYLCAKYGVINGAKTVINICSTSAFEGRANWGGYSMSKAALLSLTESWAREGIDCYSINPARTKTKMRERLFPNENVDDLMDPKAIGEWVEHLIYKDIYILSGSHIIVKKDRVFILPPRECPK